MPPASNNNGGWGYASRQGDGSKLPEKLWCYLGRHNAPSSRFSKNQLAQYHNAKRRQGKVNDKQLKMICRDHSGEPALQLKCMGPCHRLLAKTKFSRNQRQNKLRWCQQCINWRAQQDYDTVPNAHPNGVVSPGEMVPAASESVFAPFGSFELDEGFPDAAQPSIIDEDATDDEDDATDTRISSLHRGPVDSDDDSDYDDDAPGYTDYGSYQVGTHATSSAAPLSVADTRSVASRMSSLALDNGQASQSSAPKGKPYTESPSTLGGRTATNVSRSDAARHFAGAGSARSASTTMTSEATSQVAPATRPGVRAPYLPPHLRDDENDYRDPFGASVAPSVASDDFDTGSGSIVSSSQNARRPWVAPQQFNAYGPDGQIQRREADGGSVQTRSMSTTPAMTAPGPVGYGARRRPDRGNWARPDQRKVFSHKMTFATTNDDIVDIYDSGSADEM